MWLTTFFKIHLPFVLVKNEKGQWSALNREYMPLGFSDTDFKTKHDVLINSLPIYSEYKGITTKLLLTLAVDPKTIEYDVNGKIKRIYLYDTRNLPTSSDEHWNSYMEKIKILSKLKTVGK